MSRVKITIPPKTILKMLLRGVLNLSFVDEIQNCASGMEINERQGIKTFDGIVVYFEKISIDEVVLLTAYHLGREDEIIKSRAIAIAGLLVNLIKIDTQPHK